MADQVDAGLEAYRQQENITETWPARERIMVAVAG
ncbi:pressure sensor protein, partial [Brevibacterium paucivorans]